MKTIKKNRRLTKLENHNLKQLFQIEFASGKYSVKELSRKYNVGFIKLLKWKIELFGKGSLKQKRMYQMHLSGIPTRVIAEFYNVSIVQVNLSIRNQKITRNYPKKPFNIYFSLGGVYLQQSSKKCVKTLNTKFVVFPKK